MAGDGVYGAWIHGSGGGGYCFELGRGHPDAPGSPCGRRLDCRSMIPSMCRLLTTLITTLLVACESASTVGRRCLTCPPLEPVRLEACLRDMRDIEVLLVATVAGGTEIHARHKNGAVCIIVLDHTGVMLVSGWVGRCPGPEQVEAASVLHSMIAEMIAVFAKASAISLSRWEVFRTGFLATKG